jgi:hypothetical protein
MKINKTVFSIVFLLLSIMTYSQNSYINHEFSNDITGVYVPILFIDELKRTNSYNEAISINSGEYYDFINIRNNSIMGGDVGFHSFIIDNEKIIHINNNEITDDKGYKYIKISEDSNYMRAFRELINNHFLYFIYRNNLLLRHRILKTERGFIYGNNIYNIVLNNRDVFFDDLDYIYVERSLNDYDNFRNYKYIGIKFIKDNIIFYYLELTPGIPPYTKKVEIPQFIIP